MLPEKVLRTPAWCALFSGKRLTQWSDKMQTHETQICFQFSYYLCVFYNIFEQTKAEPRKIGDGQIYTKLNYVCLPAAKHRKVIYVCLPAAKYINLACICLPAAECTNLVCVCLPVAEYTNLAWGWFTAAE